MNPALKHLAERALVDSGAAAVALRRFRRRTLVLAYHNVLPDGASLCGDRSLQLPRREFARQLDHLAKAYEVVSIESLADSSDDDSKLRAPSSENANAPMSEGSAMSERPRVIITFDDAYAGALTVGVEELVKRRMHATIFVSPALLGSVPWWDILAERSGGVVPDNLRARALHALGGEGQKILTDPQAPVAGRALRVGLPEIGTELQLSEAASKPGISLGSHTWSHPNLVALQRTAMESELTRPVEWLHARFRNVVPWLSYPYGLFADSVQSAAKRAGHLGAFRIDGGWIPRSGVSSYAVPRLNIPAGLSINGFRLRLAGL